MQLHTTGDNQEQTTKRAVAETVVSEVNTPRKAVSGDATIRALNAVAATERTRFRTLNTSAGVGYFALATFVALDQLTGNRRFMDLGAGSGLVMVAAFWAARGFLSRWSRETEHILDLDDIRIVGSLVDWVGSEHLISRSRTTTCGARVQRALARLLPRLSAGEAHLLNAGQRETLCRLLTARANLDRTAGHGWRARLAHYYARSRAYADDSLILAALSALGQVGDEEAIPEVRKLLELPEAGDGAERIRVAARDCLEHLEQRAEEEASRSTLLRAAGEPEATPDTLLRPATDPSGAEDDPAQLLRPSD